MQLGTLTFPETGVPEGRTVKVDADVKWKDKEASIHIEIGKKD